MSAMPKKSFAPIIQCDKQSLEQAFQVDSDNICVTDVALSVDTKSETGATFRNVMQGKWFAHVGLQEDRAYCEYLTAQIAEHKATIDRNKRLYDEAKQYQHYAGMTAYESLVDAAERGLAHIESMQKDRVMTVGYLAIRHESVEQNEALSMPRDIVLSGFVSFKAKLESVSGYFGFFDERYLKTVWESFHLPGALYATTSEVIQSNGLGMRFMSGDNFTAAYIGNDDNEDIKCYVRRNHQGKIIEAIATFV